MTARDILGAVERHAAELLPGALVNARIVWRSRTRPCRYWKWKLRGGVLVRVNGAPCSACSECESNGLTKSLGGSLWLET